MKLYFFILVSLFPITVSQQDSKLNLICQKWRLFEIKEYNKPSISIEQSKASTMIIKTDGTYEKNIPDMYLTKGKWEFNYDSSKLKFIIIERRGKGMEPSNLEAKTDTIIKLTKDTLIYSSMDFNYQQKSYTHTNWHYVRER